MTDAKVPAEVSFMLHTPNETVTGFRHFWAKHVRGFDPSKHCARCLVGSYERRFGLRSVVNDLVPLSGYAAGDLLYFCGVANPLRWERNMHLAVRVTGDPDDTARVALYTGDELTVSGALAVPFTDERARSRYPDLGPDFLTCRNFQFGAAIVAEEVSGT